MLKLGCLGLVGLFAILWSVGKFSGSSTIESRNAPVVTRTEELRYGERHIRKNDLGAGWPLTVDEGILKCEIVDTGFRSLPIVTFRFRGSVYVLNGTAKGSKADLDIEPIWQEGEKMLVRDPKTPHKMINIGPLKKNIGPLLDAGLGLCRDRR